jgi:hypothetical protein
MADKTWKRTEREVAALIGGERVPITGRGRGSEPDVRHDIYSVEIKYRKALPDWMHDALDQAEKAKKRPDQLPIVIFREKGQRVSQAFVMLRLGEFQDWFGRLRVSGEAELPDALELEEI